MDDPLDYFGDLPTRDWSRLEAFHRREQRRRLEQQGQDEACAELLAL